MSDRCEICGMNFIDEYSFQRHILSKKHMKKLEIRNVKLERQQHSIFLAPLPPFATHQLLFNFFSEFGAIQLYDFNPRYLMIEFKDKATVEFLLSHPIYLNQWKLNISPKAIEPWRPKDFGPRPQKKKILEAEPDMETREALRKSLASENALETQLQKFLSTVQRNKEEMAQMESIVCASLDKAMKRSFPKCEVIPFGSSVTGLALVGSDLDVFLDIREPIFEDEESQSTRPSGWTPKAVFREVKSCLYRHRTIFSKIVPIPLAKIPVIKFHHIHSMIDCDVSFKYGLGVHNSQLIKYLLSLDSRLQPLVMIIKYWAKTMDISGSRKINNYSLVMLIIFYLQQPSVNLLPAIKELQKVDERIYFKSWQINFNKDYPSTSMNNSSSILELLEGFFKFYSDFNFLGTIIRPLEGKSFLRKEFKREMVQRGANVESLKLTRDACLQDPIQLDHNIISGWKFKEVYYLKFSCLQAIEVYRSLRESPLEILPKLFDPALRVKSKQAKPVQFSILAGKFERFGLSEDFEQSHVDNKQEFIETNWLRTIYKVMELIFERILKFKVEIIYDKVGVKQMKVEEVDDVHSKDRNHGEGSRIMLRCSGKYFLNRGRKGKGQCLDPSVSPIEREARISEKIMEEMVGKAVEEPIKFECLLEKKSNPLEAIILLTDQQWNNQSFTEIAGFIKARMCIWVQKELMHMTQFKKSFNEA
ncbi:speckle targeted PIP5K1A-regulated poly(A) polymerase-like [Diachasmimorpha longicaudata]|uniref:speckle targeted PIP5K1A-regulated poly(A) polymerase-like n=1 Tax=Diachasmimorpha longicaudata TaxID=58733 RepID=UPI0030B8D57E